MADGGYGHYWRKNGADMELVDQASGTVQFAFRTAAGSQNVVSSADNLVAHSGGGQTNALALVAAINRVVTVAVGNDSVKLPPSLAGLDVVVINAHASNSINVYPALGDNINALGANTAFALAAGKIATFFCCSAGQWHSILTA